MRPVVNHLPTKGHGGLWTSTYDKSIGSDWYRWTRGEGWYGDEEQKFFLLTPKKDINVYTLNEVEDALYLFNEYKKEDFVFMNCIDFPKLAKDYDGLNMTHQFRRKVSLFSFIEHEQVMDTMTASDLYMFQNCWDCESTQWFNWCFDSVEEIKIRG